MLSLEIPVEDATLDTYAVQAAIRLHRDAGWQYVGSVHACDDDMGANMRLVSLLFKKTTSGEHP